MKSTSNSRNGHSILSTVPAWLLVFALATSSLIWLKLFSVGGLGVGPFVLFCTVFSLTVARSVQPSTLRGYIATNRGLVIAVTLYLLYTIYIWATIDNVSLRSWVRPGVYACFGLAAGVYMIHSTLSDRRILAFSAPGAVVVFAAAFGSAAYAANVSPLRLLLEAAQTGDASTVVFRLFGRVMEAGAGDSIEDVKASLRHGIATALLLSAFVSASLVSTLQQRLLVRVVWVAILLSILIATSTLSRSALLMLALAYVQYLIAVASFRSARRRRTLLAVLGAGVLVFIFSLAFSNLLISRLGETTSYSIRAESTAQTLTIILQNPIVPANTSDIALARERGSHNVLLDAWVYGGLLGGLLAAGFFFYLLVSYARVFLGMSAYRREADYLGVDALSLCSMLWIPVIRFVTSGSGLGATEWIALGFATGTWALVVRTKRTLGISSVACAPCVNLRADSHLSDSCRTRTRASRGDSTRERVQRDPDRADA